MQSNSSFFILWPYIAFALLLVGTMVRYALTRWRPGNLSVEVSEARAVFGGKLWILSLLIVLAGHFAGLLFPRAILSWNSSPGRLYFLEGLAISSGVVAVATGAVLIWRHLGRSGESLLTEIFDTVFLALLFTVLVSGVLVAVLYRWGSSWGVMTLTPYAVSILKGKPSIDLAAQMPFLVQLHVLSTFAAVAVIPLTRLSAILVAAVHGCVVMFGRPVLAVSNAAEAWIRRRNLGARIWPEED